MRTLLIAIVLLLAIPAPGETSVTQVLPPELTFSKVSGPVWLDVATTGGLSGTPQARDIGLNVFLVRVEDDLGVSDEASLTIQVLPRLKFKIMQATAREAIPFSRFALNLNDWME